METDEVSYDLHWFDPLAKKWRMSRRVSWNAVPFVTENFFDTLRIYDLPVGGMHVDKRGDEWVRTQ